MSNVGSFSVGSFKGNNNYPKKKRFKVEEGNNIYRILPPFKSKSNAIAKFWALYWVEGTKGKRPVPSILVKDKEGNITSPDPLFDKIQSEKLKLESMKKEGKPEAVIKALEESLNSLNLDKHYYLNAMNPAGEIGVLKIKYTSWQALKALLEELDKEGMDPINVGPDKGFYLNFKRTTGDDKRVAYTVEVAKKTVRENGKMVQHFQECPIDDTVLARMEKESEELDKLFKPLSFEEQKLVATLDKQTIDRVFARPVKVEKVEDDEGPDSDEDTSYKPSNTATAKATMSAKPMANPFETTAAPVQETKAEAKTESKDSDIDLVAQYLNS